MKKNIEDIVDNSEDKELEKIIKEVESSYMIKGIEFVDKHFALEKYFPGSKAAKGFDYVKDFLVYSAVGMFPGEKQEKYAKHLGYDKLKFSKYSIAFDLGFGAIKLALAGLSGFFPVFAGIGIWGVLSIADGASRAGYMLVKKKPIGIIPFVEMPYRIGKHFVKKRKKDVVDSESKNLNTFDNLNFS